MAQSETKKEVEDLKLNQGDDIAKELESLADGAIADHDLTPEEDRKILRKIDLCLLPVMAIAYLFQFLDKTCLSYASILGIREELHLTGSQYSWASSVYYFGYLIASYPVAGVILVRLPIAKVISVSLVLWGGILMLTAVCYNAGGLLAVRFFLGMAESAIAPGLTMIISMWYKRSEQPLRQGAWFLGNTCAGFFGGLVGYALGHVDGIAPWKAIFLVFGGVTVAFAAVTFIMLPDTPLNARFLNREERALAMLRVEKNMTGIKSSNWKRSQVIEALCDVNAWLLVLIQLSCNIPNNGIITFSAIIVNGFGFSTLRTLLLGMINSAFQLLFVIISSVGSSYLPNSRTYFMAFNLIVSVIGSVMVREIDAEQKWARMFGVALTISYAANFPMIMAMTTSNFGGFTKKTTVSALTFIAYNVGNIIGPNLFFESEAPGYESGFLAIMICFAIGVVLCALLRISLILENRRRDRAGEVLDVSNAALSLMDKTDKEIPQFRYMY
ncbi:major facilitator superfamily domain-containing protein [Thelonectria olida]|uniref:Major facilitator superfamily domain-containing protein n=1 Tax=Thelonectria olida TaxID=1576542 RepID=A0A9P8VQE9_9HYPO|nr:major facilitator superfamily domain-containing protein [Thelonectria olida]